MDLLAACKPLHDYAYLIDRIRYYQKKGNEIDKAVDLAVDDLQDDSVIKPFIMKNRAEVKRMCITEYDEVRTMNMFKEEGREEGREEGKRSMVVNLYRIGISIEQLAQSADVPVETIEKWIAEAKSEPLAV